VERSGATVSHSGTVNTEHAHVGRSERRLGGERFLTGRAGYFADLDAHGVLHCAVLRSPNAHARIRQVDAAKALAQPTVAAVLTGADAAQIAGPIAQAMNPADFGGNPVEVRCLAVDEAVYVGQPIAAVAASTALEAARALRLIEVEYESLEAVLDAREALAPGGPTAYSAWGDNVVMRQRFCNGDPASALASAPRRLRGTISIQRTATTPIEPRGYLAEWDALSERLTLVGTIQNPHPERLLLARALGIEEERIRVVSPPLGGAFGAKMRGQPESLIVALLARAAGAPVRWLEDRRESFLAGAREQTHEFEVGFDDEGTLLALHVSAVADVGIVGAAPGWGMSFLTALTLPTGYRLQDVEIEMTAVATNKAPWLAARGFGKEASNLVMERVLDLVARTLDADPAEIRRRNLVSREEFPFRTATGLNLDSGDYGRALDLALDAFDYADARRHRGQGRAEGRLLGIGIAFELTPESADIPGTITGGFDTSTVRMSPSGTVTVLTGVTSPGGGSDTAIVQVVADRLGVPPETITLVQGDTDRCPYGFGNSSARATLVGSSSAALAADDVRAKLVAVAAAMLGVDAAAITIADGRACALDGRELTVAEIAHAAYTRAFEVAASIELPLEATRSYRPGNIDHTPDAAGRIQPYPTYSYAVHASLLEVDKQTGVVRLLRHAVAHDCGTMINPALVEGQMLGAVVMGMGTALSEQLVYDAEGHLLTDRFKTYLLPRAADVPPIAVVHLETPSPFTLLGTKGAGETGVGGAQAAIANAVDDALQPIGATIERLPLSPPEILRLMPVGRE
jgi:carbon-monoxide dehydrogenase large subunit